MTHKPPRKDMRWLGTLSIATGLLLVPGVCTFAVGLEPGLFVMFLALAAAAVFVVAGLIMRDNAEGPSAPQARDKAIGRRVTDRSISASERARTPLQRAANWGAVLFIILVLVLTFIFGR